MTIDPIPADLIEAAAHAQFDADQEPERLNAWEDIGGWGRQAYRDRARAGLTAVGLPDLLAEVESLRKLAAVCVCYDGNPENYEGPHAECPVHGAVRAFNDAVKEIEQLRGRIAELEDALTRAENEAEAWRR